jgi:tetratricopeptide (TPR) repeat protein
VGNATTIVSAEVKTPNGRLVQNGWMPGGWADEPFVGRDELFAELADAATEAARGHGAVVVLRGEAGIGKTTVVRKLADHTRADLTVSWAACPADQSAPPYWPWRALVTIDDAASPNSADPAVGAARYEQLTVLRDRAAAAVHGQPRLHIIEDLQWADVTSVLLLAHVGAAIVDVPLLIVATLRTGEPRSPQLEDAVEEVCRAARLRELGSFSDVDIATLLRRSGTDHDAELVELVRARTGGNPLCVTELLRAVGAAGSNESPRAVVASQVPSRVSELMLRRLDRLPAEVVDALYTASVIGAEGDTATVARVRNFDLDRLLDDLDQARAAHFLDVAPAGRWRFRHELIRDAVYTQISERARAQLHAGVLEALAADPAIPASVLARHALAALPVFDADRAVALAARAGEVAFAANAYEEAVEWFGYAFSAAPSTTAPRWRAELLVLSGEARRQMGDIESARGAFVEAAELSDDPELLARAALGYASPGADLGVAYRTNNAVTAPLLEHAIAVQPPDDANTLVALEARLAAELYFSDDQARARTLAVSALERARRLGDARALGIATAVVHDSYVIGHAPLEEQLIESKQLLDWAAATGSAEASLTAHRARAMDLLAAGDLVGMDNEVLAFQRIAEPLCAPGYLWWPVLWSAMRALLEGRHDVAEERAIAAFQLGERPFVSLATVNLSFLLFFLRREQGRLHEIEALTRDFARVNADVPALRAALMFLLAEIGRVDEVSATLAVFDDVELDRLHDRNWPASWFQLARAAAVARDRNLATSLLEPKRRPSERYIQVSLATVCLGAADLATAWLLHTVGDLDAADAAYRSAEELNARIGARSWLAQTRADHARLLFERDRGDDHEVADELRELALAAAREIGLATIATTVTPTAPTSPSVASATFRRSGPVWDVSFAGRAVRLPDARGLHDLAQLLRRPGEAVSVLELIGDGAVTAAPSRGTAVLDDRARREIRARLHELDVEEADAEAAGDGERAALAREQRQALAEAVARDVGLGGRSRTMGDPVERVRKTVTTRIRRAISTIGRSHPELGRHLERSVDTGAWCAYRPAEPVDWQT